MRAAPVDAKMQMYAAYIKWIVFLVGLVLVYAG
jgi:hypothetical protein